jgi:hypothetical protein
MYPTDASVSIKKKAFATEDTEVTEEDAFDWFCSVISVLSVAGSFVSIDAPRPGLPSLALTGHVCPPTNRGQV